ncbi:DUF6630 family protein [Microbacterium murale]|uniref:DUF6630 domain-containing protein n=1 Tax=Microbacterium murale TaxID=1081040 RepID=A0ABU0P9R6_9MICO|nr:hypothetical protein [Microbacterium murale]MDQ0644075.1 hypothetical protein [Microbacterium murale]
MSDDWTRLCALLDDDAELAASVRTAVENPAEYYAAHADDLRDRGIESAADIDPWLVIIDGLDEAGALAYLDWKDGGAQLADALAGLPRIFATGIDLDAIGDIEAELPTAVAVANGMLDEHGLTLVYLEEDSDAYPLVAVEADDAEQIVALASSLGHVARTHP